MICTLSPARRGAAALLVAAIAVALSAWPALAQTTPTVSVNPSTGPAGSTTTLTLQNFDLIGGCNPNNPSRQTCIYVDFKQGTKTTTIAVASGSGSNSVRIPAACASPTNINCSDAGGATITATSPNGQNGSASFTVSGTPASTTPTTAPTTTTTVAPTTSSSTSSSTTVTTIVLSPTSTSTSLVPVTVKKASKHSDVPRYIAVALVVLAAAATAAVDTRQRRLRGPAGP
ncbi:MAG TPA: hypothetical protein VG076_04950 [Acidimicrobiales bacterium]|nr:hypothetical protein [Acidimicrobiales bacterium]